VEIDVPMVMVINFLLLFEIMNGKYICGFKRLKYVKDFLAYLWVSIVLWFVHIR